MESVIDDLVEFRRDISSKNHCLNSISTFHSSSPEIVYGSLKLNFSEKEDFIMSNIKNILLKSRSKWAGLYKQSVILWEETGGALQFAVSVTSETSSFSMFIVDFIKSNILKLQDLSDLSLESEEDEYLENDNNERGRMPADLVQIVADGSEVKNWIDSFITSRRELVNNRNNEEFFLSKDKRLDCARVDAVLIKRKDTVSHITVEHVKNLWGPQVMKSGDFINWSSVDINSEVQNVATTSLDPTKPSVSKKIYSAQELDLKLEELKEKLLKNSN